MPTQNTFIKIKSPFLFLPNNIKILGKNKPGKESLERIIQFKSNGFSNSNNALASTQMIKSHHTINQSKHTLTPLTSLIDHCLSFNYSPFLAEAIHALSLKLGLNRNTFIANRLLNLYSHLSLTSSTLRLFEEIPTKNTFTYNILLSGFLKSGRIVNARHLFAGMPERDSVTWNTMISGYASMGIVDEAFGALYRMQESGTRPTGFTFSIAACCATNVWLAKQVHANAFRNGFHFLDTVIANSFISMYGDVGLVEYACTVFRVMGNRDLVSWNTMMSVFGDHGQCDRALGCLREMRAYGLSLDAFTISTAISVCADNGDLPKGEQLLAHCFKIGCISNSIVSSAIIDMYSNCGRLDDSIRLFQEMEMWDSALCNSMASAYAQNWLVSEALKLFVVVIRVGIMPTEFTFASILSSSSCFGLTEQGTQIHCWVVKLNHETDRIVASALVDMYTKLGAIESAMRIFFSMATKDLISCNTMILGLARNGQAMLALRIFEQMLVKGLQPDRITLIGVLTACGYGGMITEGKNLFLSMKEKYGIACSLEHYACIIDMMTRAGSLREAMEIIETMPHKPTLFIWNLLLEACRIHGDMKFAEIVAEKVMELKPYFPLPYTVLGQMYGMRGKWESVARVQKAMAERGVKKVSGCSWIGVRDCIFVFESDSILHHGGEATYSLLRLLVWEMKEEGYVPEQHSEFEYG